jgi:hypothetical protein
MKLRSGLEATVEKVLHSSKVQYDYESETLHYTQPEQVRRYLPDFRVMLEDKGTIYLEVKGILTSADRKKLRLVKEQHPDKTLIFVFGSAKNKLNKKSPTTYADWCDKYSILWVDVKDFTKEGIKCLSSMIQQQKNGTSKNPPTKRSLLSSLSESSVSSKGSQQAIRMLASKKH